MSRNYVPATMWNARKVRWTPIGLTVVLVAGGLLSTSGAFAAQGQMTIFQVRVENISYPKTADVLRVTISPTMPATAQKH
jgi:hypothetical protein